VTVKAFATEQVIDSGVPVANVRGVYSMAVAEMAIAMMLCLTRRLTHVFNHRSRRQWPEDWPQFCGENCFGKTLGIVGYGSIGRHVARIAHAMGMQILACKRDPSKRDDTSFAPSGTGDPSGELPRQWFGPETCGEMLRDSDVAVVTLPDTPDTRGMINRDALSQLMPDSYLISVGTGAVIDEDALHQALARNRIAGAALDVFTQEPLTPGHPLWELDNLLIFPHIASYTRDQGHLAAQVLLENTRCLLEGRPFVNLVDLERGY
jgi:phosphoglycerate dehydrogenase-like enzyme